MRSPRPPSDPDAFRRVVAALEVLRDEGPAAADLRRLARRLGVSADTVQRQFTAWAGLSPKRFALARAAARGRAALARGRDVLAAALDAGLSGPGRLHDALVHIEAVAPGDVRRGGAGVTFRVGTGPTPFGPAFVATTARGVHRIGFVGAPGDVAAERRALEAAWPAATIVDDDAAARAVLRTAFARAARTKPLRLWVRGTNLQVAVWRALLAVPPGACVAYADVAAAVGAPTAVRAVGSAVGRNPVAGVIPCHRVLRGDGGLGGYAWGLGRKAALLAAEVGAGPAVSAGGPPSAPRPRGRA